MYASSRELCSGRSLDAAISAKSGVFSAAKPDVSMPAALLHALSPRAIDALPGVNERTTGIAAPEIFFMYSSGHFEVLFVR